LSVNKAIETIKAARAINVGLHLEDIEFQIDGKVVEIDEDIIRRFSYLGLNNTDFIREYFMKEKFYACLTLTKPSEESK
jgi:hypothetical protein